MVRSCPAALTLPTRRPLFRPGSGCCAHAGGGECVAVTEAAGELGDVRLLLGEDEGDAGAAAAGAAGAADAMHVVLVAVRRVEVDHVRDVVDVEAACGDVRRDERRDLARLDRESERSRWFCDMLPCIAVADTFWRGAS